MLNVEKMWTMVHGKARDFNEHLGLFELRTRKLYIPILGGVEDIRGNLRKIST